MAYIGNDLQVAYSRYTNIDDISASFNGTTTSFALLVNGVAPVPFPINSQQCLISVGGVLQQPDDSGASGFRLSGNNIVFSSAPATGEDFFGVILAGADYVNVGANFPDGSAAAPSITFDQDTDTGFYRAGPGSVALSSNGTPVITVDTSRRVGIGTSSLSPTYEQTINGDGSSIVGGLSLRNNNTETLTIGNVTATNDVDSEIWNPRNGYLRFATSNTERMRIDSAGHLGLGATPSAWGGASGRGFNIGNRAVLFNINSGSLFGDNFYYNGTNDLRINASYASRIFCNDTGQITTQTAGTSTAGSTITWTQGPYVANLGTSWTNSSDERLKTITGEIGNALNKVSQLRAAEFYWKSDESKRPQVGLIAQDLVEVLPEVVVVPESDENDGYGKQNYLGVNYDQVIPLLVAALKESKERIETLEAKVDALEAA